MFDIGFSELLIDGGLGQSLIRAKEVTKIDYSTVFIFNIFVLMGDVFRIKTW